jgi:hypothetical protein
MSTQQAAVIEPTADPDLDNIAIFHVPKDGPPLVVPLTVAEHPAASKRTGPPPWAGQFAVLLAETLTGVRPVRQVQPWLSQRGSVQLRRLLPLMRAAHRPRVLRVLTATPSPDVVEMTLVVLVGTRARALAVRLERSPNAGRATLPGKPGERWLCTDIEAG